MMAVTKEGFHQEILRLQAERKKKAEFDANLFIGDMIEKCRRSGHHRCGFLKFTKGRR